MKFRTPDEEAVREFQQYHLTLETKTIPILGHHLHFVKTGNDSFPTIIFVHGSPGSWNAFEAYLRDSALLSKYRLISLDRPGFGYSDFGDAEDLYSQSTLLGPLIQSFKNHKPIYLVGHSLGGPMIVKIAADNPNLFDGLVILSGSVDPSLEEKENWRPLLYHFPMKYLVPGAMRPSNEELWYLKKDLVKLRNEFVKISCPVFIIHGDKDNMVPIANVQYAKKLLVNAKKVEVKILPGANHFIPWLRYDDIKEVLMRLDQ